MESKAHHWNGLSARAPGWSRQKSFNGSSPNKMIQVSPFLSFTIAVLLLIVGKILTMNIAVLRKYSIPEPVVGGI
ncbi:sodium/glutamate symporter, partial [Shinella sp.]|uniref:sodium/glutamate symporter n=1 Tax=Shinella sp. TaxID=1870904 RepID=UPI003F700FAE